MAKEKKLKEGTQLSYSSANLILGCTQKYMHHKVWKTEPDPQPKGDREPLDVGSAMHLIIERTKCEAPDLETVEEACKIYNVENKQGLVHAMSLQYAKLHAMSGLQVVAPEIGLLNKIFEGYVDLVVKDKAGYWWISDTKSAKAVRELTLARLHNDTQLSLYASFKDEIARIYKLAPAKFKGIRYRVVTKSEATQQDGESYEAYVKRVYKSINAYDVLVPASMLKPKEAYGKHEKLHKVSLGLRDGSIEPIKNYAFCDAFFKPCEFWTACHGKSPNESLRALKIIESNPRKKYASKKRD